jgi:hypothetical protein
MRVRTAALIVSGMLALAVAMPVAAKDIPRTGDQLNLFDPPTTMAANEPFWVGHGWCSTADDADPMRSILDPTSQIVFTADGAVVATGTDVSFDVSFPDGVTCITLKINYHNFRVGLPIGSHTIAGCWYLLGELQFCREAAVAFE